MSSVRRDVSIGEVADVPPRPKELLHERNQIKAPQPAVVPGNTARSTGKPIRYFRPVNCNKRKSFSQRRRVKGDRPWSQEPRFQSQVSELVNSVTSDTAVDVRFDKSGAPIQQLQCSAQERPFEAVYNSLLRHCPDFKRDAATLPWVRNHFKWIVWKLAAMERALPKRNAGCCLIWTRVLEQIRYRYQREHQNGNRSVLRKALEGDASSARFMVLCVSAIRGGGEKGEQTILELTDGWYAINATLDRPLQAIVAAGKIFEGQKLRLQGAMIKGCSGPVTPLDCKPNHSGALEKPELVICANGTRRARWDTPLGLQRCPFFGSCLSSLYPDGGYVGYVRVIVSRIYPVRYLNDEDGRKLFLSATQEDRAASRVAQRREELVAELIRTRGHCQSEKDQLWLQRQCEAKGLGERRSKPFLSLRVVDCGPVLSKERMKV